MQAWELDREWDRCQDKLNAIEKIADQMYVTECSSMKMNQLVLELRKILHSSEVNPE